MATTPEQLRGFLGRPWGKLRESKDRHTAALVAREGIDAAFRIAQMLREHARAMGAEPSREARDADLAAAVRLKELLDRASRRPPRAR